LPRLTRRRVAPVSPEIALHRGIRIEGKVTDQETETPVPGCWLGYFPFLDHAFAGVAPEFVQDAAGAGSHGLTTGGRVGRPIRTGDLTHSPSAR
jgi:hypothetical protein